MAIKVNGTTVIQDSPRAITNLETALSEAQGGTGQTTYTNGQLLIGNTTGGKLNKSTLTAGANITITNGAGSITIAATDTNTTYSAGTGVTLAGTTFSIGQAVGTGNNVQFNSIGVNTAGSGTAGEIRATNNITAYYSDDRLKTRLGYIENALEKVCSLSGFYYEANETAQQLGYEPVREVGVSAQEVQKILPEVVVPAPIDDKYLTVRYEKLIPLLIEAIKDIKQELNTLKGKQND